jgi:hypothetical protein
MKGTYPAFPAKATEPASITGLTKREFIATMVAAGKNGSPKEIAEHAVWVADELLKQLNKEAKNG